MTRRAPTARLSAAQIRAVRRAVQRQLTRSAKLEADDEARQRSSDLRQALRALRMFRDGCQLHPIDDPPRERDPP